MRAFLFGVPPGFHGEPCADFSRCGKIFSKSLKIISEKYFSRHIGATERRGSGTIGSDVRAYRQQEGKIRVGETAWSLGRILLKAGSKVTSRSFWDWPGGALLSPGASHIWAAQVCGTAYRLRQDNDQGGIPPAFFVVGYRALPCRGVVLSRKRKEKTPPPTWSPGPVEQCS